MDMTLLNIIFMTLTDNSSAIKNETSVKYVQHGSKTVLVLLPE